MYLILQKIKGKILSGGNENQYHLPLSIIDFCIYYVLRIQTDHIITESIFQRRWTPFLSVNTWLAVIGVKSTA